MSETRQKIIDAYPIADEVQRRGISLKPKGNLLMGLCPFHNDKHPSLQVDPGYNNWSCFVCGFKGLSVIDFIAKIEGRSEKDVFKELAASVKESSRPSPTKKKRDKGEYKYVETYDYTDAHGRVVFHVDRFESTEKRENGKRYKKFPQWQDGPNGTRVDGIAGVERMLYRLSAVLACDGDVWLVEGEKCVHAMESHGYCATTNPGGSSGWLSGYAESLRGKDVSVMPDNDDAGGKWADEVVATLEGIVKSCRICRVPAEYNDIADLIADYGDDFKPEALDALFAGVARVERGVHIPVYNQRELLERYTTQVKQSKDAYVDLGKWLPSFKYRPNGDGIRPLPPGSVVAVVADTGVGKTAILQNIARCVNPLTTLMFELEISDAHLTERNLALSYNISQSMVEERLRDGRIELCDDLDHILVCPESGLSPDKMGDYARRCELKFGVMPKVLMIDYVGLMNGKGGTLYERITDAAERVKVLAKQTNTVVVMASQRPRSDRIEVDLHDAKNSGSIENSAQLMIGAWRPENNEMTLRVLKQTRGKSGLTVKCNFDGESLRITEQAREER